MADMSKLSHLLDLADDEAPVVREAVARELAAYGPDLDRLLETLSPPASELQRASVEQLLHEHACIRLREQWPDWDTAESTESLLEPCLALLAAFQNGPGDSRRLRPMLDALAAEYVKAYSPRDPHTLARYLFDDLGIHGDRDTYYSPENSNLVEVIDRKCGIPISLVCLYILVGQRVGVYVAGCNWPGHFLARVRWERKNYLVDCFNGGQFFNEDAFIESNAPERETARTVVELAADARTIVVRVLNNLIHAYHKAEDPANARVMEDLLTVTLPH